MSKYYSKPSYWLRCWVWTRVFLHVIAGVCTLSCVFPFLDRDQKDRRIWRWAQRLLEIFHIRLQVIGGDKLVSTPYLIASNHISWLDIHVINAFKPIRFVAKSEVRGWPIFGWMAEQLGTVFIRRDSSRHAREVVGQMAGVLKTESICIFPEGTSTSGELVLPFKPNLFESALLAQVPVYPMAIAYRSKSAGGRSDAPAFIGDMGLVESMANVINNRDLEVYLSILDPCIAGELGEADRKTLAIYCRDAIAQTL